MCFGFLGVLVWGFNFDCCLGFLDLLYIVDDCLLPVYRLLICTLCLDGLIMLELLTWVCGFGLVAWDLVFNALYLRGVG